MNSTELTFHRNGGCKLAHSRCCCYLCGDVSRQVLYLDEHVVVLDHQGADVNVPREGVVPVALRAHLSPACDILNICQTVRRQARLFNCIALKQQDASNTNE